MSELTHAKRSHLRRIFLQKRSTYSPTQAAKELGITRKAVLDIIEHEDLEADTTVSVRVPWQSLATLAMDTWTVADLIEALGKDAPSVVPALLFPADPFQVTLPLYLTLLLGHLASEQEVSVNACLARLLHDYVYDLLATTGPQIEEAIPGFHEALFFPRKPVKYQ